MVFDLVVAWLSGGVCWVICWHCFVGCIGVERCGLVLRLFRWFDGVGGCLSFSFV